MRCEVAEPIGTPINVRSGPGKEPIFCTMTLSRGESCHVLLLKCSSMQYVMCWGAALTFGRILKDEGQWVPRDTSYDYTFVVNPNSKVTPGGSDGV